MANLSYQPWRIAHTESSLGWGGQEHRVLAELTGFQKRGATTWLLAPPSSAVFQRAVESGVPVVPLHATKLRFVPEVVHIALWLIRHRVQVLNPHSSRDGWLAGLAGRLARVPLIVRTRHIDVDYPHVWVSRQAFVTLADHVLTTSDKITRHFQDIFQLSPNRISTVPTGIDLDRFSPDGPRANLSEEQGRVPIIGMVSVLRSWKGHETFFQAARLLVDAGVAARFIVVGGGASLAGFEQRVRDLNLQAQVSLAGHREDVPEVLRALSVLVIPSTRHEGVPQIGLQALAVKTPVVGSDVGGIPEIVRPGETGRIFPAGDAAALAVAIRETLQQTDITRANTVRGRAMVEQRHGMSFMLDSLDQIYRRYLKT